MRFEQLKYFVEVAETGSITVAAKKLFVSQQVVSVNIKQLEEELSCPLLFRTKTGVSLTDKGRETAAFARKILSEKDDFCSKIMQKEEDEFVQVKICSTSSVTNIVLPNVIERMEAKHKKISLKIALADDLDEMFACVANGQCDFGLVTFNADELSKRFSVYQAELQLETLARDEMVGVLSRKFFAQEAPQISREEFWKRRHSLYNIIPAEAYLPLSQKNSIVWSNDAEFHRAILERNGTLVLMPSLAYQYFFSHKTYIALPVEGINIPLLHAAICRKDAPPYIQEFIAMIRLEMYLK